MKRRRIVRELSRLAKISLAVFGMRIKGRRSVQDIRFCAPTRIDQLFVSRNLIAW